MNKALLYFFIVIGISIGFAPPSKASSSSTAVDTDALDQTRVMVFDTNASSTSRERSANKNCFPCTVTMTTECEARGIRRKEETEFPCLGVFHCKASSTEKACTYLLVAEAIRDALPTNVKECTGTCLIRGVDQTITTTPLAYQYVFSVPEALGCIRDVQGMRYDGTPSPEVIALSTLLNKISTPQSAYLALHDTYTTCRIMLIAKDGRLRYNSFEAHREAVDRVREIGRCFTNVTSAAYADFAVSSAEHIKYSLNEDSWASGVRRETAKLMSAKRNPHDGYSDTCKEYVITQSARWQLALLEIMQDDKCTLLAIPYVHRYEVDSEEWVLVNDMVYDDLQKRLNERGKVVVINEVAIGALTVNDKTGVTQNTPYGTTLHVYTLEQLLNSEQSAETRTQIIDSFAQLRDPCQFLCTFNQFIDRNSDKFDNMENVLIENEEPCKALAEMAAYRQSRDSYSAALHLRNGTGASS